MFTSEQYRAKALEYSSLIETSAIANEKCEYQKLQQTFAELADIGEWLAEHHQQTLHASDTKYSVDAFLAKEEPFLQNEHLDDASLTQEEQILRYLGAALIMQWGTLPRKLRRELFDDASAMGNLSNTGLLRGQIACFLHKNKNLH
jgi:hypothetical protein